MKYVSQFTAVFVLLSLPLFAKCPISPNGTLEMLVMGNLVIETTGTDSVEVSVQHKPPIAPQETCESRDRVVIQSPRPAANTGVPIWTIKVPKGVTLDLTTQAGYIQAADTDGEARLRTTGGPVTAGNIRKDALIITQGGSIKVGNIGGTAELISEGGPVQVGNIGGSAILKTKFGEITAGRVQGNVEVATGSGGKISIRESNGKMIAVTEGGDITSLLVRGPLDVQTGSGNITVQEAKSWIRAYTGLGDIFLRLVPENLGGDLHISLDSQLGNITLFVPEKLKATIDTIIDKPVVATAKAIPEFGNRALGFLPGRPFREKKEMNGGGNLIKAHTASGSINITTFK